MGRHEPQDAASWLNQEDGERISLLRFIHVRFDLELCGDHPFDILKSNSGSFGGPQSQVAQIRSADLELRRRPLYIVACVLLYP